jgi:hypothetical protein
LYEEHTVLYSLHTQKLEINIAMAIFPALKKKYGARFLAKEEDNWT